VVDLERQSLQALVTSNELSSPVWSPDGAFLFYVAGHQDSGAVIYRIPVDGSAGAEEIARLGTPWFTLTTISPDGNLMAGYIWDPETETDWDLWIAPTDGSAAVHSFMAEDTHEFWPQFSPDGKWIAFVSNRTGSREVYIKRFPEAGGLYQLSDAGARRPVFWTADKKGILFMNPGETEILRVDITLGDPPRFSKPRKLLDIPPRVHGDFDDVLFSPHPDGQRLLVIHSEGRVANILAVVENWFPQLRALAPDGD
jgi:Tol biopolymer transport system component